MTGMNDGNLEILSFLSAGFSTGPAQRAEKQAETHQNPPILNPSLKVIPLGSPPS